MKKFFAIEKNASLLKKLSSLLKHLWHQKNLCYIVNILIKLGAYLHSEVHFCPHSRCQILWERCLFSTAYVSLWIFGSMTPRSVQSTKQKFQSVANQFYWVSQSKPPRFSSCSLKTYKQNDKFQNFQYFCRFSENDDLFHFLTITCKNNFRCRMSSFICKICSTELDLQTLWKCCLLSKKLWNEFDWNIHLFTRAQHAEVFRMPIPKI